MIAMHLDLIVGRDKCWSEPSEVAQNLLPLLTQQAQHGEHVSIQITYYTRGSSTRTGSEEWRRSGNTVYRLKLELDV